MSVEFYRESKQIARKEHKCNLCGRTINKGEEYVKVIKKCYMEELFTSELHLTCHDLFNRYTETLDLDDYFDEDEVIDSIHEKVCCDCLHQKDCKYMYKGDGKCNYREVCLCPEVISTYLITKDK